MTNRITDKRESSERGFHLEDAYFYNWIKLALIYFIVSGSLGVLLRLAFIMELPAFIQFKYIVHTHSHVAIMGWIFTGLYIIILKYFNLRKKLFYNLFWLFQIGVIGMMLSFPVQGYGMISIFFTSLHMIVSYVFIYYVFKEIKLRKQKGPDTLLLKTALIFLFTSTLGIWALGYIMNSPFKGSAVYYASIQFFLHFQFNGWFIFAILAILANIFKKDIDGIAPILKVSFYWLMVISCLLTYTLAVTWSTPKLFLFLVNSMGVVLQFGAFVVLYLMYKALGSATRANLPDVTFHLWRISFICFTLKIGMQTLVGIPYLATVSYTIKNFVIGFIHLLMLGTLSTFIIGCTHLFIGLSTKSQNIGLIIFIIGFVGVEVILFLQGLLLWLGSGFIGGYYLVIFIFSALMPIGILIYTLGFYRKKSLELT